MSLAHVLPFPPPPPRLQLFHMSYSTAGVIDIHSSSKVQVPAEPESEAADSPGRLAGRDPVTVTVRAMSTCTLLLKNMSETPMLRVNPTSPSVSRMLSGVETG